MVKKDTFTHRVFLCLGSNLGERERNLKNALAFLTKDGLIDLVKCSSIYRSEGIEQGEGEPEYLNQVIEVNTPLPPEHLLNVCKRVESKLGRSSGEGYNGPRIIDIDILFYDELIIKTEDLVIPHPRAGRRRFVLQPLSEIASDFLHPVMHLSIAQLLKESDDPGWVKKQESGEVGFCPKIGRKS